MQGVMRALVSPRGLAFDKYLVRYSGQSLLNHVFAYQNGIKPRPALLLRTIGHQTGVWREAVLPYFNHGDELVVVGSRGGMPQDPAWVTNLRHNPTAELFIGRHLRLAEARFLLDQEYLDSWKQVSSLVPTYDEYQQLCKDSRTIPLIALKCS